MNSSSKRRPTPHQAIAALVAKQHGVVAIAQLLRMGVSRNWIKYQLQIGRLYPIHRGVYAVGHTNLSREGFFIAAVLAVGDGAVLSHLAGATLLGFWRSDRNPAGPAVTVARNVRARQRIEVHRVKTLSRRDITYWRGIPVTTAARTLVDMATVVRSDQALKRAAHEAQVQRRVTHRALKAQIERDASRPGAARLASLIARGPARTRSELEDATLEFLERNGFPRPEMNVKIKHLPGAPEVDFLFTDARLVIEADSDRFHGTAFAREEDARKQAMLEAAGYRVLRVTSVQLGEGEKETAARFWRALGSS